MKGSLIGSMIVLAWWAVLSPRAGYAQETINYASLSGGVTDPQGAVVPGAQVAARNTGTNVTSETVTDRLGRFRFPYLRIGTYELKVHLEGFADFARTVRLTVGSAFDVPVALALAGLNASVTVSADAVLLETAAVKLRGPCRRSKCRTCR